MLSAMAAHVFDDSWRLVGIATTASLLAGGLSRAQIDTAVRRGSLSKLGRGVYADAAVADQYLQAQGGDQLLRVLAGLAVAGPGAVVSHQSAARLYGVDLLGKAGGSITLTGPPARGRHSRPGIRLHAACLPQAHVSTAYKFPITTPARTVVDLARELSFRGGVVAADSALHGKLTSEQELTQVIASCRRWRGVARAAAAVDFADNRAESPLESIARIVFHEAGLPPPELQAWLGSESELVGRVDFYWAEYRTIVEVDGELKYGLDPHRARQQLERDRLLREAGYEVLHFDWNQIVRSPDLVIAAIRQAFKRGARARG
jgi:predicted transcriptional regulator of viral defense system